MIGIRIRHLVFTGPSVPPATLEFRDGLNIIYGASNTGKSFTSKSILFMLGAIKALPETEQVSGYDGAWLGLSLPYRDITLYRSTRGGHFKLHEGLVSSAGPDDGQALHGQHDSKRTDTVSHVLLDAIGLAGKLVVRDASANKDTLSIRLLAPYAIVSEEDIIAEKSPVLTSGTPTERTFEQNLFKLLLTGIDDAAAVTVQKPAERKVAKAAKVELVDEMIAQIDQELGNDVADEKEIGQQLERLNTTSANLFTRLRDAQSGLDGLVRERRTAMDRKRELEERGSELALTLQRFAKLQAVYASDLQRLQSLEEGGYVLVAMAGMDCPVCGAAPEAQRHNHAAEEIAMAHTAAAAEARKIEVEQRELAQTVSSLEAEHVGLGKTIAQLKTEVERLDEDIEDARPFEVSARQSYEQLASALADVVKISDLYERRSKLMARKAEIESEPTKREGDALQVGPDATTAFKFGETIKDVLTEWRFPDADKVQFDRQTNDITIGGKGRSANGKGVRAILHAAFNVALVVYCIDNKLPHPGFLVLDTPLLTYREPLQFEKHGELADDELALKGTSLAEHFYRHLASLSAHLQVVVIENSDPPAIIRPLAHIETFTGLAGNGRFGLFERRV